MRGTAVAQLAVAAVCFGVFGTEYPEIFEAALGAYPGYSGSLSTGGSVVISQGGSGASASQVLGWKLIGADVQGCGAGVPVAANSCGVHIHSGTTGSDARPTPATVRPAMGRVRTKTVKGAARQIVEKYFTKLTLDFQMNKKISEEVATIPSKHMRNNIADSATHLVKRIQRGPVRGFLTNGSATNNNKN